MTSHAERAAEWIYNGLWGVLVSWFNVPRDPPTLPAAPGEEVRSLKPSRQYLKYRKLYFWVGLTIFDFSILAGHEEKSLPLRGLSELDETMRGLTLETMLRPPVSRYLEVQGNSAIIPPFHIRSA